MSNSQPKSIVRTSSIRTALFGLLIFFAAGSFDPYNQGQLAVTLILFIGILSIVILTGISGQISLGQGALMAVGGYSTAILIINFGISLWIAVPLAIVSGGLAGIILGTVAARLTGPYLAGTTLVVALAIPSIANRFGSVFKGDEGFQVDVGYPPEWFVSAFGDPSFEMWQFYVALPFALIAVFFASNLLLSRSGRVWRSIRDHEIASSLTGVKVSRQKVFVFTISAAFAGLAGALYGLRGSVGPSTYPTSLSLMLLTGAILGGIRSIAGAFIGSVLVVFLPDWIDYAVHSFELSEQVSNYLPALVGGILLILTVVINPAGVAGGTHLHKRK